MGAGSSAGGSTGIGVSWGKGTLVGEISCASDVFGEALGENFMGECSIKKGDVGGCCIGGCSGGDCCVCGCCTGSCVGCGEC